MTDEQNAMERRTIIRAGAWSTPIVAAAVAAPFASASAKCKPGEQEFTAAREHTFRVSKGTKWLGFEVVGAGGGSNELVWGQGERLRGNIYFDNLTADRSFKLVVGGGGKVTRDGSVAIGGWGCGDGGASTPGKRDTNESATGGGGGGSAILFENDVPLVIAGGGGGQAVSHSVQGETVRNNTFSATAYGFPFGEGSAGGPTNGRGLGMGADGTTSSGFVVSPAVGAVNGTGGVGGGGTYYVANGNWTNFGNAKGATGGGTGTGRYSGGNGGSGSARISNGNAFGASGGGGGGGYAGGGGGGLASARFKDNKLLTISAGSGAAGSSFVRGRDNVAKLTVSLERENPRSNSGWRSGYNEGHNGYIKLWWCF